MKRWSWIAAGALGLLSLRTAAAQAPPGALAGKIVVAGAGVPDDARVVAECRGEPPVVRTVDVAPDGSFLVDELPSGPCLVHAEAPEHDPAPAVAITAVAGEERRIDVELVPRRRATAGGGGRSSGVRVALVPLASRTVEARVQLAGAFEGDRGPFGGFARDPRYGNQYRLDGFQLTDPLRGGAGLEVPLSGLVAVTATSAAGGAGHAGASGAEIDLVTRSGSNRGEIEAVASRIGVPGAPATAVRDSEAAVALAGPLVKDHLWFATSLEGHWSAGGAAGPGGAGWREERSVPRGWGKLTWQASARNKLSLLALASDEDETAGPGEEALARRSSAEGRLVGGTLESLITDDLVARVQAGWRSQQLASAGGVDRAAGWQGAGRLQWFGNSRALGEHAVTLDLQHEALEARFAAAPGAPPFAGRRTLVSLEDAWRPTRAFTITLGAAWAQGSFAAPAPPPASGAPPSPGDHRTLALSGATPHLGLAWDATHDGRTVVRASASGSVDAGSFTHARLAAAAPAGEAMPLYPVTWELTGGAEREVSEGIALSGDVIRRWRPTAWSVDPRAREHRALMLGLRKRTGRLKYMATWVRQTTAGAEDAARLALSYYLGAGLGAGATVLRGNRVGFARLAPGQLDAPGAFIPAADGGGSGWQISARLTASLGPLVGENIALWVDALDLGNDRAPVGTLATADGASIPVAPPGRQLRVGLAWSY
jgi:hypothetical protein